MTTRYRAVSSELLDSPEFQQLSAHTRLVYIALTVTLGPSGIEERYPEALVHELLPRAGGSPKKMAGALGELEAGGWMRRQGRLVWVVRQLEMDPLMQSSNESHRKSMRKHVDTLPDCPLTREFVEHYGQWFPADSQALGRGQAADSQALGQRRPSALPSSEDRNKRVKPTKGEGEGKASSSIDDHPAADGGSALERAPPAAARASDVDQAPRPDRLAEIEKYLGPKRGARGAPSSPEPAPDSGEMSAQELATRKAYLRNGIQELEAEEAKP